MALAYKTLAQVAPSATTLTTLYTCPALTQTVVSSIAVCNRGGTTQTYRIAIRPNGEAVANKHYIVYDKQLAANSTDNLTIGVTVDASDVITVYASTADFSFNAFGVEIV